MGCKISPHSFTLNKNKTGKNDAHILDFHCIFKKWNNISFTSSFVYGSCRWISQVACFKMNGSTQIIEISILAGNSETVVRRSGRTLMAVTGNDTSKVRQTCSPLVCVNLLVVFFLMIFGMFEVLQILKIFLLKVVINPVVIDHPLIQILV